MRTRNLFLSVGSALGLCLFLQPGASPAGYRSLINDFDKYEPPQLFQAVVDQAATAALKSQDSEIPNAELDAEIDRLHGKKAAWEKALKTPASKQFFFTPEQNILDELRGAADDPKIAEAILSKEFTLQQLEVLTLLRNPGIKAEEQKIRATLERYPQAWNLDEVLSQYAAFTSGLMTKIGPMKGQTPMEMKFPFPGILALKGEIVNQEVAAVREDLEAEKRSVLTMARKAYWNLLFTHRAREISRETLNLLEHLEAVATTRYESGKTSFQDVIKVRIRKETVREDLVTLDEKQQTLEAKIRQGAGLETSARISLPAPAEPKNQAPELNPLFALALERKQELRRMKVMIGKMERMIEMTETMLYPAYAMNLSLFQNQAAKQVGSIRMEEPFATTAEASMGAGLPKRPWYGTSDAYLRETRKKLEALRSDLKKTEDMTVFQVREAWARLDQAAREETLYRTAILDLSQAALEVSTTGYETGAVMFADVIASYRDWLEAKLALDRRRADLGVAWAELEEAVGATLSASK